MTESNDSDITPIALPRRGAQIQTEEKPVHDPVSRSQERLQIRIMLASYSDILFVLMPFLLILILKGFREDLRSVLGSQEWALASAVLAGLAVVKLMLGLVSRQKGAGDRERLVFMVAAITFLLLMPSLLLAAANYISSQPLVFLVYVQPILLVVSIAVYTGVVNAVQRMLQLERD